MPLESAGMQIRDYQEAAPLRRLFERRGKSRTHGALHRRSRATVAELGR